MNILYARQNAYKALWQNENLKKFNFVHVSLFPAKMNGGSGWSNALHVLGAVGVDWYLTSCRSSFHLAAGKDDIQSTSDQNKVVLYCNDTWDSLQVKGKLLDLFSFTKSIILSFEYMGIDYNDACLIFPTSMTATSN